MIIILEKNIIITKNYKQFPKIIYYNDELKNYVLAIVENQ